MICAREIFKSYQNGKAKVLCGASLDIVDGEYAVILGASGSGKSTLLSILSGLERADSGDILYGETRLNELSDKELTAFRKDKIGFVFQQYFLLPHLSVEGNIRLGADLKKNRDYSEIAKKLGLQDKLSLKPAALSGGEQQRVAIARALSKLPEVLFLDEPTGALDEATGREVLDFLLKLKAELGFTMVMVTHNQNIAETADKIIRIVGGKATVAENPAPKTAFEIGW